MRKSVCALSVIFSLLFFVSSASALSWNFEAISASSIFSGFSIVFDDMDNDNIVGIDDVISFSGISYTTQSNIYEELLELGGKTTDGLTLTPTNSDYQARWMFHDADETEETLALFLPDANPLFSYSATAAPVPEPATLTLMGLGLLGLGGLGRKRLNMKK